MKRAWLLVAVLLLLVASLPQLAPRARAQGTGTLILTGETTIYLLPGTSAKNLSSPVFTYRGTVKFNATGSYCMAVVSPAQVSFGGLEPRAVASCNYNPSTSTANVTVFVNFAGTYMGGNVTAYPIGNVTVTLFNVGGAPVASATLAPNQRVSVIEDTVTQVAILNVQSYNYTVVPAHPTVDQEIQFVPVGNDVELGIYFSEPLSATPTITVNYQTGAVQFTPTRWSSYDTVTVNGVPLWQSVPVTVYSNNVSVYSGYISASNLSNLGAAAITTGPPILNFVTPTYGLGQAETEVVGQAFVEELSSGTLIVTMYVSGKSNETTVTSPGPVNIIVSLPGTVKNVTGYYNITYIASNGQRVTVKVPFSRNYALSVGYIVEIAFIAVFAFMIAASAFMIIAGLFLRNFGMVYSGFMTIIGAVLLFLIPTLIGDIIYLLNLAGFSDPALVGTTLTIQNLGRAIDNSISYVYTVAVQYSNLLYMSALAFFTLASLLLGSAAGASISWFLRGISNALALLADDFVMLSAVAFILAAALNALALLYGVFIAVAIVVMLLVAVAQIIFGAVTGNMAPAFNTIIGMAETVFMVLLAPVLLSTLNLVSYKTELHINIGPLHFSVPTPATLGVAIFVIVILVMVLVIAMRRMLSAFGGVSDMAAMI